MMKAIQISHPRTEASQINMKAILTTARKIAQAILTQQTITKSPSKTDHLRTHE